MSRERYLAIARDAVREGDWSCRNAEAKSGGRPGYCRCDVVCAPT
jgi:hypothetical protein